MVLLFITITVISHFPLKIQLTSFSTFYWWYFLISQKSINIYVSTENFPKQNVSFTNFLHNFEVFWKHFTSNAFATSCLTDNCLFESKTICFLSLLIVFTLNLPINEWFFSLLSCGRLHQLRNVFFSRFVVELWRHWFNPLNVFQKQSILARF